MTRQMAGEDYEKFIPIFCPLWIRRLPLSLNLNKSASPNSSSVYYFSKSVAADQMG
jgi:hypothetical protein